MKNSSDKSLESWIWDAACSIRGAQEAPKFKDFILPLIFTKRLCDVFDDELNGIAQEVGSRAKAFNLVDRDHKLVRFYLPLKPQDPDEAVWSVIRKLAGKIGESLTTHLHDIAKANPALVGIIDRMDFNATTHGQRDIGDDRLSNLIERISEKRLGLKDVEAGIIGRSYEYLIRMRMTDRGLSYEHNKAGDQVEACRCLNAAARLMGAFNDAALTLQRLRTADRKPSPSSMSRSHRVVRPLSATCSRGPASAGEARRKMGNAMHRAPRCGAYARTTRQPCRSPAMRNGRCRMHGGKAGRKPTHGHYTKAATESRREVRAILRAIRELIDD